MIPKQRNHCGGHPKEKTSRGACAILAAGALALSGCATAPPTGPDVTASAYPAYTPYPAYYPYYGSAFFGAGFGFHRHFHRHRFPHHDFSHHQFHHAHR